MQHVRQAFALILICLLAACGRPAAIVVPTVRAFPTHRPLPTLSTDCAAGSHVNQLVSGAEMRQYRLYVPRSYQRGKPVALIFGFHGNTGHADQFEAYSGFSPLAEREGFIVVYPQGAGGQYPTWETKEGSKDVQFVRDLIVKVSGICSIDSKRIYAVGHSLGGGMANRLACDLAERIAAIGPVSGAYQNPLPCTPTQPVAVVAIHGTNDSVVFYQGIPPGGMVIEAYTAIGTPIPQWASGWAGRNDCDANATVIYNEEPVSAQQWSGCRNAADVVLYTIRGGEHGWPSEMDAPQVIWDFFAKHTR